MRSPPSHSKPKRADGEAAGMPAAETAGGGGDAPADGTAPDPLTIVIDPAGRIVSCNDAFTRFTGKEPGFLLDQPMGAVVATGDGRAALQRALDEYRAHSSAGARVDAWLAANGEPRPVQWWLTGLRADSGDERKFVVTAIDLSFGRNAWNYFAEQEAKLQSLLDTAVDGIVTIDECGVIESVNRATEEIFGYASTELIGRNVKMLMPAPYREAHDSYLSNYLNTGERKIIGIGREVEGRRKDGSSFPLDLAVSEFYVAGRRHFMGVMRDISGRKRAEHEARRHLDELAHASRLSALGQMATGIAHEINQPLAAVVSYAQACLNMLNSSNPDGELVKDALVQISAQGQRAGDIIHHLRQLVRKESPEPAEVNVNSCVRAVLNLFAAEIKAAGITLSVKLYAPLPEVEADRVQIEQVLLNLIRNAIDVLATHSEGARKLEISTRPAGDRGVEVRVSDTGPGLKGNDPERLFENFYTNKPHGLGVGLSISRSIIESHGGLLWAKENRAGGLSLFFTVPGR